MTEHHSVEEYRQAIRDGHRTTVEISDALGVTRQGALKRLKQLREEGHVESEDLGGVLVWSVTEE